MDITFKETSNGELSCSYNNVRLHSFYNPLKEAERFAESAECFFSPSFVLVTEPCISYCASFLRKRFPKAKLCCIRFSDAFSKFNGEWDKVFNSFFNDGTQNINLSEDIFNYMNEEGIVACLFLSWKASDQAFPDISKFSWDEIKKAVIKSRSILGTRNFFAKRWTKNALRFSIFAKKTADVKKGNSDILICASGPSLYGSLENIKKYRERFFLIAVSSALSPLVTAGIIPDLCISTDGGFWAKLHISFALKKYCIPLALPGEGSCFASIMNETRIIPLFYGDGTSEAILKGTGFRGLRALRNGSVSGTALQLALSITDGNIYCCGLDLAFSKGFVHTQPNELEINEARFDSRLRPTETRITRSVLNKGAIDIYKSWFSSMDFGKKVYRLSNNYNYGNNLGKIPDVDWEYFEKNTLDYEKKQKPQIINTDKTIEGNGLINRLKNICRENSSSSEWIHNAVPSEVVVMDRCKGTPSYNEAKNTVDKGIKEFIADITRAIEK